MPTEFGDPTESEQAQLTEFGDPVSLDVSTARNPSPTTAQQRIAASYKNRLAEDAFTPTQLGALQLGIGPLASMIGSRLRGRPVTQVEAGAEGALEQLGKVPGDLGSLGLQAATPTPVRLAATLGEALGVVPKNFLEDALKKLISPAVEAPSQIATALGIEQGPERAKFREPEAAGVGEFGTTFLNPVVGESKAGEIAGRAPAAIRNAVEKLSARGITRAPLEDAVTRATGLTAQEGALDLIPIVKTQVLSVGPRPQTAQKAIVATQKAADNVIGKALNGMERAESQGLAFSGGSIKNASREQILFDFPSMKGDEIESIVSSFDYLSGNIKPTQGQGFLRELNSKYLGLENKNSPEASAYRAVRGALSDQLDDVYKLATGVNDSPYRQWGNLQDFIRGVNDQIVGAQRTQGGKAERGVRNVPVTEKGLIEKSTRVVARPFVPREIEAVDRGIQRIFSSEVSSLPKPSRLTPEEIAVLREKYVARPPVQTPPIPEAPPSLNDLLEQTIQSLPREMRGRNERAIAEALLRSQASP